MFKRKPPKITWQFYKDESGQGESRHSGISHFSGNQTSYVARECIQNSLDAAEDNDKAVEIYFDCEKVSGTEIQARTLAKTIQNCLASGYVSPQDKEMFRGAEKLLNSRSSLECLTIRDENTKGAPDIASDSVSRGASRRTPWNALTRWSGVSGKRDGAMGSWGLGKNAAFAASRCRTVLYTTHYLNNSLMKMESRFIGKAIFVSHEDDEGNLRHSNGFFENIDKKGGFQNEAIPDCFRRSTQGTTVWILEYPFQEGWQRDLMRNAAEHFFPALEKGKLKIFVDGDQLELAEIIADRYGSKQQQKKLPLEPMTLTQRYVRTLAQPEHKWTVEIPDIGKCSFAMRLENGKDAKSKRHSLALVRGAGMFLTDQRRNMGGVVPKRFSPTTKPFTALLWCSIDRDYRSLLRDCENTRHDEISRDHLSADPERHKRAEKAFEMLRVKVQKSIKEFAESNIDFDEELVSELAEFVWRNKGSTSTKLAENGENGNRLPILKQRQLRLPSNAISNGESTVPRPQPGPNRKKTKSKRKNSPKPKPGMRPTFGNIRFRTPQNTTHETVVSFDANGGNYLSLSLLAEGEDGEMYTIRIMDVKRRLKSNTQVLNHNGTFIDSIGHKPEDGERVVLHIKTQEPIGFNSLQLKRHTRTETTHLNKPTQ